MAVDPEREQVAARLTRLQRDVTAKLRTIAGKVEEGLGGIRTIVGAPPPSPVHLYRPWREQRQAADLRDASARVQLRLQRLRDGRTTDFVVAFYLYRSMSLPMVVAALFVQHRAGSWSKSGAKTGTRSERWLEETLWDVAEVATFLGVSKDWVYRRAASGDLPSRKVGPHLRFLRSEVVDWCEERASAPAETVPVAGVELLVLRSSEAEARQSARLSRWLDDAMVVALTEWKRSP